MIGVGMCEHHGVQVAPAASALSPSSRSVSSTLRSSVISRPSEAATISYARCCVRVGALVEKKAEMTFDSRWGGQWKAVTFHNKATGDETIALVKGKVDPARPTLVRMHTACALGDGLGVNVCGCAAAKQRALQLDSAPIMS